MTHIITSNQTQFRSVKEPVENLTIVHYYETALHVGKRELSQLQFDVYLCEGMEIPDDVLETQKMSNFMITIIRITRPQDALDRILETVIKTSGTNPDDDPVITIAGNLNFSKLTRCYLSRKIKMDNITVPDIGIMSLIEYFGLVDFNKLCDQLKAMLGVTSIYQDESTTFAYAVRQALVGG